MRKVHFRPAFAAASVVAAAGILAAGLALRPAFASSDNGVNPNGISTCISSSPCQIYKNKGGGAGVEGIDTKATGTMGVFGTVTSNTGTGVVGTSTGSNGNGVSGTGQNTGVSGNGGTWGVFGFTSNSSATGVEGQSDNGDGVVGYSVCCNGVDADSNSGNGLVAIGGSGGVSIYAIGGTNDDIVGSASWGSGKTAVRGDNGGDTGTDGDASEFYGSYIGVIARSLAGQGFPIDATDQNGNNLMWVDGVGDIYYHGSLVNFARTRYGQEATSYTPKAASPTIEDNGTAQMTNGVAEVRLDPTFASSIDNRRAYQVMLTPDGDTKGLYIANKTPTSFEVREVQGGHGTLAFDYHIYAPTLSDGGARMSVLSPAQQRAIMPHAPIVPMLHVARPNIRLRPTH